TRLERGRICRFQASVERPVLLGPERLAFLLALDDYPECDRLHAAGADPTFDLVPQERTYLVSDQAIEHPARLLRVEKVVVELFGLSSRLPHGRLGYLVQQPPPHARLDLPELIRDMPRDSFTLAIGVGRQVYSGGLLCLCLDFLQHFGFAGN